MTTTTNQERLRRTAVDGITTGQLPDTVTLGILIRAVCTLRASRAVRLAQRARVAGNEALARRLAIAARQWAGLPPMKG